jgi:DNA-directed RNA polymerase subunit RPC12/RpoP
MDITFNCPNCKQEMLVDAGDVGREVECPSCGESITIPEQEAGEAPPAAAGTAGAPTEEAANEQASTVHPVNAMSSSAAAKESRHYAVPAHEVPSEVLISKPQKPLEVAAKESDKKMRIRTIRRTDCVEVGKDLFDQRVSDFLALVGETNIVSINTIAYTHVDLGSHQLMTDFGVMIVFKG